MPKLDGAFGNSLKVRKERDCLPKWSSLPLVI